MRKIQLDIRHIHTVEALHIYLQYMLDFPAYYGRNLDALYDMLCQESEPTQIEVLYASDDENNMKAYYPKLMRVLRDAACENGRLQILC